ncbi:MAG: hypothetical protein R6U96_17680 [Promethearchaeia archaeon]
MTIIETIKKRLKRYHIGIWFAAIFLISLGVGVYITRWMIRGTFQVGLDIPYSDEFQFFSIRTGYRFLQPLFLGPIFGIIYYVLMKWLLGRVEKEEGNNQYFVFAIEIGVVIFIIFNCIGHVFHLGMEYVNALDALDASAALDSEYREMFIYAWYLDEILGHNLIQVTYFGYLILGIFAELLIDPRTKMVLDEYIFVFILAYEISILNGDVANSSKSGFLILLIQIIFVVLATMVIIVKKIDLRYYPLLLAMLLSTIFVLYFNVEAIMQNGIQANYPFW